MNSGRSRNPVELVAYDPGWPAAFQRIRDALHHVLQPNVMAIDHIGSTSIPGMVAKPLIDLDVTLRGHSDIAPATKVLISMGYEPRGNRYDDDMWAFLLRDEKPGQRIYLCPPQNRTHIERMIFRDYLVAHGNLAADYAALKLRLAAIFRNDGDAYTAAKRDFIRDVLELAQRA